MKELNSIQLSKILERDNVTSGIFKGVFARDKLPFKIAYPTCLIFNTDKSDGPGEHWLALYYNKSGNCYFYDPYGLPPDVYNMKRYLHKTSKRWTWNSKQQQSLDSNLCGYFCVLFLLFKARGFDCNLNDNLIRFYFNKLV